MARCSRSQGHCSRKTAVMWRSETSSWPTRQSSKAGAVGHGLEIEAASAGARPQGARQRRPALPGDAHDDRSAWRARSHSGRRVVEPDLSGWRHAVGFGDEVGEVGRQVVRYEHGGAVAERPQRGCGRELGDGADVEQADAHVVGATGAAQPRAVLRSTRPPGGRGRLDGDGEVSVVGVEARLRS